MEPETFIADEEASPVADEDFLSIVSSLTMKQVREVHAIDHASAENVSS